MRGGNGGSGWVGVHRAEKVLSRFRMERMRGATRQWYEGLYAEWVKAADANKTAEVPYNWSRVVRKAQIQQWQAEARQIDGSGNQGSRCGQGVERDTN